MIALQDVVCRQLSSAELYFPLTDLEMHELVSPDGLCVGVEYDERLVAFFGILFMGDRPDNVGQDMGIPNAELPLVAYFKATNVLPEFRGQGLQKRMTQWLFSEMGLGAQRLDSDKGMDSVKPSRPGASRSKWLSSTVSPLNLPSLKSFLDSGFWIAGLKPKYLGSMRFLMVRQRVTQWYALDHSISVPVGDYAQQISLLDSGWSGVKFDSLTADPHILYIRSEGQ